MSDAVSDAPAIVVTGASRGIGAAIAVELARRGRRVVCLSRSGTLPAADGAPALAERLVTLTCDVASEADLRRALQTAADQCGGLGGLVNNAGIHQEGPSRVFSTAAFEHVLHVNTVAVFVACREAYPHLVAAGGGLIVNIGSFFDRLGAKGSTAYCASKAAVGAITRCLAAEWGRKGISVLNVAPGYIETDINREYLADPVHGEKVRTRSAIGRAGQPHEVARLVASLYVERNAFLTGQTITIDGGHSTSL